MTNEVLYTVKEENNILQIEKEHVIEGKREERTERMEIRVRSSKQLLYDLKETIGYWKCKEEVLDRPTWRTGFGKVYGPVVRQTRERILQKLDINLCGYLTTKLCFFPSAPRETSPNGCGPLPYKGWPPMLQTFQINILFQTARIKYDTDNI